MATCAVRTVQEKAEHMKARKDQQRKLGGEIDRIIAQAENTRHGREVGCGGSGLCPSIGRGVARFLGLTQSVGAVATSEHTKGPGRDAVSVAIFGKSLGKKGTAQGKLEAATVTMRGRVQQLEARAVEARECAQRAMREGNKASAVRELRKAKMISKQALSTQSALDAVEAQSDMLEQTALQREVASALGATAKSLKKDKGLLSKAEDAVDAASEMRDLHEDLSTVMAGLGDATASGLDDDDLMVELQEMMTEEYPSHQRQALGPEEANAQERAAVALQRRHEEYDELEKLRQGLPAAPSNSPTRGDAIALLPRGAC